MKYLGPEQRGSVGNLTYARNRGGQYVRTRSGRGGTPFVSIGLAVAAWQALTPEEQASWGVWSSTLRKQDSLGQSIVLSGYQLFCQMWMSTDRAGEAPLTMAPTERRPQVLVPPLNFFFVSGSSYRYEVQTEGPGGSMEVQVVRPYSSPGTLSPPGRGATWRTFGRRVIDPDEFVSVLFGWEGGAPPSGSHLFLRARAWGFDWLPGPWLSAPMVVAP